MHIGWVAHSPKGWGLAAQLNGFAAILLPSALWLRGAVHMLGMHPVFIVLHPQSQSISLFSKQFSQQSSFYLAKLFYKSAWNKSTISVFHVGQRVRFLVHELRWGLKVRALVFQTQWDTSGWSSGLHTADVSDSFSSLGVHTAHHRVSSCHRQGLLS